MQLALLVHYQHNKAVFSLKKKLRRLGNGFLAGLFTGVIALFIVANTEFERSVGLSWLFGLRGQIAAPQDVAIVAIDSRTGEELGLPSLPREWPRSVHARLVDELARRGASAIAFDMQFDRPRAAADDAAFAQSVNVADRVALVELIDGKRQPISSDAGTHSGFIWIEKLIQPLPSLVAAAKGLGTFPLPKNDAAVYEFWSFKESLGDAPTLPAVALQIHASQVYPQWLSSLTRAQANVAEAPQALGKAESTRGAMHVFRQAFQRNPLLQERLMEQLRSAGDNIPPREAKLINALARMYSDERQHYLNFYGPPGTIATIPYQAVLNGSGSAQSFDFHDKIVFVGYSDLYDPGQPDRFYTVFTRDDGVDLSGVEIAATAAGNLLTDRSLRRADTQRTGMIVISFALIIGVLAYALPAAIAIPVTLALAITYAAVAQHLFNSFDYWLPIATPMLAELPVALFLGLFAQYVFERRRGKRISQAISYYLPENIAKDLGESRIDPSAFNKVLYSTCLATDMSGFSTIAETLPPGELAKFLNDYFDTLAQPLKKHQVHVTEFRADAIMCAWTAAEPERQIRKRALLASLDAAAAIAQFKVRTQMTKAALRIGLEAGTVYIGHAGGGGRFVFSIVGDCANTASRIEGLNKYMGTEILATGAVVEGLDEFLFRNLGNFQFVGKSKALPIVEVMATKANASESLVMLCEKFAVALSMFHRAEWQHAANHFESILSDYPNDGPSHFFLARCRLYQDGSKAPDESAIIRMDAK